MASRLQDVILRGLAAARPLATDVAPGTLYFSTDTEITERCSDDGLSWESYTDAGAGGSGGITGLTGDVTAGPGVGSQVATLANTAVTPGSYTATNLTVDSKGRITTAASGSVGIHAPTHGVAGADPVTIAESQVTNLVTDLAAKASTTDPRFTDSRTPTAHATTHSSASSDPVTVTNLAGFPGGTTTFLRADGTFASSGGGTHATTHSSGGADPVSLLNLAGYTGSTVNFLRADGSFQPPPTGGVPAAHATTHEPGGADAMAVDAVAATGSLRTLGTGATQATAGNDARLSDTRVPTAHATTHNDGGSDEVTLAQSQVTNLTTDLAGKADTTDPRFTDSRTPTAHKTTHEDGGSDEVTLAQSQITNLTTDLAAKASTTDPRFTDARTPTAHASTHASAGSDPVTLAQSQVTGLTTDLAGKASTTHAATHSNASSDPVTVTNLAGYPGGSTTFLRADATFATPAGGGGAHASTHSDAGADEVDVTDLGGFPGGTTTYLRADGTFATPAGGGTIRRQVTCIIDGGGEIISDGPKGVVSMPVSGTWMKWRLLSIDEDMTSGAIEISILRDTYAGYSGGTDNVSASTPPNIASSGIQNESSTLTGWITSFSAGDIIFFYVNSVSLLTKVSLTLEFE